jgi:hypothetical protein
VSLRVRKDKVTCMGDCSESVFCGPVTRRNRRIRADETGQKATLSSAKHRITMRFWAAFVGIAVVRSSASCSLLSVVTGCASVDFVNRLRGEVVLVDEVPHPFRGPSIRTRQHHETQTTEPLECPGSAHPIPLASLTVRPYTDDALGSLT